MENTFNVGDQVLVTGNSIVGEVIEVGGDGWRAGKICVRRPNPAGGHMTHWVKADRVQVPEPEEDDPCIDCGHLVYDGKAWVCERDDCIESWEA